MTLRQQIDEIFKTESFGQIEIKCKRGKESIITNYYSNLLFGEVPDNLYKKDVVSIEDNKTGQRIDYLLVVQ